MATDQAIETEIQTKGLAAPRVTPERIEAVIAAEHYFRASDGVEFATPKACNNVDEWQSLRSLTFCVLVMVNGFTVTGESACASPENFDAELGKKIARANAVAKIWPLEGYLLKQHLSDTPV